MDYILHILIIIGIYTILSVSLNLLVGYTGILSVAHAAFYGVGAYIVALMALRFNSPFIKYIFSCCRCCGNRRDRRLSFFKDKGRLFCHCHFRFPDNNIWALLKTSKMNCGNPYNPRLSVLYFIKGIVFRSTHLVY